MNARLLERRPVVARRRAPPAAPPPCEDLRALARRLADVPDREFRELADVALALLGQPATQACYDAAIMLDVEAAFEDRFAALAHRALDEEFAWSESDQAFVEWAARASEAWGRVALDYASHEVAAMGAASPLGLRLLATAMARLGDGAMWRAIAGRTRRDLAPLHAAYLLAEQKGMTAISAMAVADGVSIAATPEALYVRALLIDTLCSGHFGRRICRQVSRWLLAWCGTARVRHVPTPEAPPVAIDVAGGGGLTLAKYFRGGSAYFLAGLDRLAAYIGDARGRVDSEAITSFDGATPEEREAGLRRIASLLEYWTGQKGERSPRAAPRVDTVVPCAVGLAEILEAFGGEPQPGAPRRMVRVLDISETGMGLAFDAVGDRLPVVGDLMGFILEGRFHLGEVVRIASAEGRRRTVVGMRLLSTDARIAHLEALGEAMPRYARGIEGLALPASALLDDHPAIVVRASTFVCASVHEVRVGESLPYRARLSTVLRTGNGWGALAVEVPTER